MLMLFYNLELWFEKPKLQNFVGLCISKKSNPEFFILSIHAAFSPMFSNILEPP